MFIYVGTFIVTAAGSIFWNYACDKTMRPKLVMSITCLGACGIFQLLQLMPYVPDNMREIVQITLIMCWTFCYCMIALLIIQLQ